MSKEKRLLLTLVVLALLAIPSFFRMLKPGIYSMHDFHIFRMLEYHKCISDLVFPCRWAPDSGFGYGEPVFNFYGQFPYILGEPLALAGVPIIDTIKFLFIFSLVGSALSMFVLSRYLFKSDLAALASATLYIYAPYRAVDVWVRGALPEALAFVFFPLVLFFFTKYVREEKIQQLLLFSLFLALLINTHNLSFLMFAPFLSVWGIYFLTVEKKWRLFKNLSLAGVLSIGLSAFYLLPVLTEGTLTNLGKTTQDYYNFGIHFTTINQLFISRIWDYGASHFGTDDALSFSAGHVQWVLSLIILISVFVSRRIKKYYFIAFLITLAWFALFLTHGRSVSFWVLIKPLAYVQFPWRFLTMSTLFFAIAAGSLALFIKNRTILVCTVTVICALAIGLNFGFFREDRWFVVSDKEQFFGDRWQEQIASAVNDFWPTYGPKIPNSEAPKGPQFIEGEGSVIQFKKKSHSATTQVSVTSSDATVQFPIVFFDGWKLSSGEIYPSGDYGQITTKLSKGEHNLALKFTNTPVRTVGNLTSLVSTISLIFFVWRFRKV